MKDGMATLAIPALDILPPWKSGGEKPRGIFHRATGRPIHLTRI